MRELSKEEKLFFFERNWFTLDGLWFLEIENEKDWMTALKIDKNVWIRLLKTIFRRLKRYLDIETNTPYDIIKMLTFRWFIEGWGYKLLENKPNEIHIGISTCPYKEMMDRNPERRDMIKIICEKMCHPFYKEVIEDTKNSITFNVIKSQGLGDDLCDFKFAFNNNGVKSPVDFLKQEASVDDKLFYYESHWFTMDGLWMVETENELGYDLALKIDTVVWQRLYQIIFRRMKRYLNIEGNSIKDLIKILEFMWACEGYKYEIVDQKEIEALLNITGCPYKDMMDRNPARHDRIEAICKDMCIPFYEPAIEEFNPEIVLERRQFLGVGDSVCDFHFKFK
ncbi:MAG: DUF6125 family protein [Promethearchaeota archaeon]